MFVIESESAKDIRRFSQIPGEEEVVFPPNAQFEVVRRVTSTAQKRTELSDLSAYDMNDLDVYVLREA